MLGCVSVCIFECVYGGRCPGKEMQAFECIQAATIYTAIELVASPHDNISLGLCSLAHIAIKSVLYTKFANSLLIHRHFYVPRLCICIHTHTRTKHTNTYTYMHVCIHACMHASTEVWGPARAGYAHGNMKYGTHIQERRPVEKVH